MIVNTGATEKLKGKIFGGTIVHDRNYPYVVSIVERLVPHCAGALLSEKHVLTAGHCISKQEKLPFFNGLLVIVGSNKWTNGTYYRPIRLKTAPGFKETTNNKERTRNDIGVITVGVFKFLSLTNFNYKQNISLNSRYRYFQ